MFFEKIESQPLGRSRAMSVAMLRAQLRIDYKIKLRPGDLVASQGGYLGKIFCQDVHAAHSFCVRRNRPHLVHAPQFQEPELRRRLEQVAGGKLSIRNRPKKLIDVISTSETCLEDQCRDFVSRTVKKPASSPRSLLKTRRLHNSRPGATLLAVRSTRSRAIQIWIKFCCTL